MKSQGIGQFWGFSPQRREYNFTWVSVILTTHCMNCEGFAADEAASLESLEFRQQEANSLFLGYYEDPGVPCAVSHIIFFFNRNSFVCY